MFYDLDTLAKCKFDICRTSYISRVRYLFFKLAETNIFFKYF